MFDETAAPAKSISDAVTDASEDDDWYEQQQSQQSLSDSASVIKQQAFVPAHSPIAEDEPDVASVSTTGEVNSPARPQREPSASSDGELQHSTSGKDLLQEFKERVTIKRKMSKRTSFSSVTMRKARAASESDDNALAEDDEYDHVDDAGEDEDPLLMR